MQNLDLIQIGTIIVLVGMVFVIVGAFKAAKTSETKVAVGGFIGPIPFGFANEKMIMYILIGVMIFTVIVWAIFNFFR